MTSSEKLRKVAEKSMVSYQQIEDLRAAADELDEMAAHIRSKNHGDQACHWSVEQRAIIDCTAANCIWVRLQI